VAVINTWRDLKVWQKAHELVLLTYNLTAKFPSEEKYGLSSQIRRAAVSVASNIVEGFRRRTIKGSLSFYNTADGSLEELKYQSLLAGDLHYISRKESELARPFIR
jgi:four helix bundle protein